MGVVIVGMQRTRHVYIEATSPAEVGLLAHVVAEFSYNV